VGLSHAGLVARGLGEEVYLEPLMDSVKAGAVQADRWLALYHGKWGGRLEPIYGASSL